MEENFDEYTSTARFDIHVRGLTMLDQIVADIRGALPPISVDHIRWHLTDETWAQLDKESRKAALRDAMAKAVEYGEALGLVGKTARVVEINDVDDDWSRGEYFSEIAAWTLHLPTNLRI